MQPLDGPLMTRYRNLARQHQLWLSLGGFQETGPDPSHLYNCHVIVSAAGDLVARYRKVHLFDVEVQNGPVLMESRSTAPGNEVRALHCTPLAHAILQGMPQICVAQNAGDLCVGHYDNSKICCGIAGRSQKTMFYDCLLLSNGAAPVQPFDFVV